MIGVETMPESLAFPMVSELQWGHAMIGVETLSPGRAVDEMPTLQWGHAMIGVETSRQSRRWPRDRNASMGPRHDWRGDAAPGPVPPFQPSFNGATP